jgi:tetratricopeptide (TPR) repeat protein
MRSNAQTEPNQDLSALLSSLQKNPPDSTKVELLLGLSRFYYFERSNNRQSLDSMFSCLQVAKQICDTIPSLHWQQPEIFCYLGKYYFKTGNPNLATEYYNKVSSSMESISGLQEQIYTWEALGYHIKVMDTVGFTRIDCFEKMLSLHRQLNNKEHVIGVQKLIADTHLNQGKLDLADKELTEVLTKYKAINFRNLHHTYYLLSITNQLKGNYSKALEYGLLAIESMQKTKDYRVAINLYSNLAHLHDDLGQTNKSIEYYHEISNKSLPNLLIIIIPGKRDFLSVPS